MRIILGILVVLFFGLPAAATPLNILPSVSVHKVRMDQYAPDTIVISTKERRLYYKTREGEIQSYRIGVGKHGMTWSGTTTIAKMVEWPDWHPTPETRQRAWEDTQTVVPERVARGRNNPLGARALYLFEGKRDTLYRIHGTNEPGSVGHATTAGCFRMRNADVMDLYDMVRVGTKVVVLP